jgi:hypothetical protein
MDIKAKTRTEQILTVMQILAWVAFIGYMVEAGAILVSYGVTILNPDGAKNLYRGLNLNDLRVFNFWDYTHSVSFLVALSAMKSYVWYLVIKTKIKLANPFTIEVTRILERISYVLFGIWLVGMLSNAHNGWLLKRTGELFESWNSGEFVFIFMAGLVFIISQIFKRGVEIQSENELTV